MAATSRIEQTMTMEQKIPRRETGASCRKDRMKTRGPAATIPMTLAACPWREGGERGHRHENGGGEEYIDRMTRLVAEGWGYGKGGRGLLFGGGDSKVGGLPERRACPRTCLLDEGGPGDDQGSRQCQ